MNDQFAEFVLLACRRLLFVDSQILKLGHQLGILVHCVAHLVTLAAHLHLNLADLLTHLSLIGE